MDDLPIVAIAADVESGITGDQWKQYNTAFTLYQNNMNHEALNEFKKYLVAYPNDQAALWLVQNVLEKNIIRRLSTTASLPSVKVHNSSANLKGKGVSSPVVR